MEKQNIIKIVLKSPSKDSSQLELECPNTLTVTELKKLIEATHPQKPASSRQRLIFGGKLLRDTEKLSDVTFYADLSIPQVFHLVISRTSDTPSNTNLPSPPSFMSSTDTSNVNNNNNNNNNNNVNNNNFNPNRYVPFRGFGPVPGNNPIYYNMGANPFPPPFRRNFHDPNQFPGAQFNDQHSPHFQQFNPFQRAFQQPHQPLNEQPPAPVQPNNNAQQVPNPQQQGLNFNLIVKLLLLVYLFSQGGSNWKIVIMSIVAFFIYLYQTGRLRILARVYVAPPARANNDGVNNNNNQENVNNNVNVAPQTQRQGVIGEILGFFLPLVYSLFPNWEPTDLVPPRPGRDNDNADARPHQE
eukprot:TRINITY_DN4186_c0_g1_i1.p1 TRINITY_DN4186_c0_g1~~TRINITY_DN4186_c0_g1_i1.p1  ORF type:complete len:379 (-),score=66.90 TRINITY_DN4186_c0_g1_i1:67-1134(-)